MSILATPQLHEAYQVAYQLYQNKHYLEALPLFRMLVIWQLNEKKYWKGMAACSQMTNEWEEALFCYKIAISLAPEDLDLFIHASDCCFSLGAVLEGLNFLDQAKQLAKKIGDQKILAHVALMNQVWNSKEAII